MAESLSSIEVNKKVVVDTNLLLDDSKFLFKLIGDYKKVILPITVLQELDRLKFKPNISFSAREAIRSILEFKTKYPEKLEYDTKKADNVVNDDEHIINSAIRNEAVLATKDVSMSVIAESMGAEVKLYDQVLNNIFKPYAHIKGYELISNSPDKIFSYNQNYSEEEEYNDIITLFEKIKGRKLIKNTWHFIIIDNSSNDPIIYANNPLKHSLVRIDNDPKYRKLSIKKEISIKPLDTYQICAVYAMIEAPNVLICGSYGSGKSLLATAYALSHNTDRKTFISRPNLSVDSRFNLGFLPGSIEDKLLPWMSGVLSGLYHIFSNTKSQTSTKMTEGTTYDMVKEHIFKKYFEMMSIETIQGMSFMDNDLLILDETQLCSISILSVILSRFGKGAKLIMTGDTKQAYGAMPPSESGLVKLLRLMPRPYIAYIELRENYRSQLLELADDLQNKTLV